MIQQKGGFPVHRLQCVLGQLMQDDGRAGRDFATKVALITDMDLPVEADRAKRIAQRYETVDMIANRQRINVHSSRQAAGAKRKAMFRTGEAYRATARTARISIRPASRESRLLSVPGAARWRCFAKPE